MAEWSLRLPKLPGDERVELDSREQCFDAGAEPGVNTTEIIGRVAWPAASTSRSVIGAVCGSRGPACCSGRRHGCQWRPLCRARAGLSVRDYARRDAGGRSRGSAAVGAMADLLVPGSARSR